MTAPDPAGEELIRVVLATWGDDDADRVTTSVARGLRDAGVEVVHASLRLRPGRRPARPHPAPLTRQPAPLAARAGQRVTGSAGCCPPAAAVGPRPR